MSGASVPDTRRQIVHLRREQTDFWRSAFPSDCFIHYVAMQEPEGSHVCRYRLFTPPDSCWNEYEFISQSSVPCLCPPTSPSPPYPKLMTASPHLHPIMTRMLRQLKMFTPVAKKKKERKKPSMLHKVACFHFDGIANQSDVIYVCFELEMSPGWDIGGGPTLLGAAKPYGEFTHCICFLSVQQIGNRITLLLGYLAVLTAKYSILLPQTTHNTSHWFCLLQTLLNLPYKEAPGHVGIEAELLAIVISSIIYFVFLCCR